jgi:cytoskeletal protein RodZ
MASLGERLRVAREARGLSLSEVSEQIRIRTVYLVALEEENWRAIGAPVYVRGFLRTYARFLGLDPEEVVAQFGEAVPPEPASEPHYVERTPRRSSTITWVAACIAVLLVAFVAYNALTMRHQEVASSDASAPASPAVAPSLSPGPATGSPAPASRAASPTPGPGRQSLALVLSAPSWLRVVVDGNVSMEGTFPAGTSKTFHGRAASVRVGNAGGVEIYVDGKDVGKLGKSGDVVDRAFVL